MAISTRTILSQPRSDWRVERRGDVVCAFRCTTPVAKVSKSSLFVTRIHVIRVRRAGYPWKRSIRVHSDSNTQTMEWITCSSALSTEMEELWNDVEWKAKKKSSGRNSRDSSAKHRPGPPRRRSLQRRRGNSNVLVRGDDRSGQFDDVRDDVRGKVAEGRRRLAARVVTAGIVLVLRPGGPELHRLAPTEAVAAKSLRVASVLIAARDPPLGTSHRRPVRVAESRVREHELPAGEPEKKGKFRRVSLARPRRRRRLANRAHPAGIRRDPRRPQTLAAPSKRGVPAVDVVRGDLLFALVGQNTAAPPSVTSRRRRCLSSSSSSEKVANVHGWVSNVCCVHLTGRQGLVRDLIAPAVQPEEPGLSFRRGAVTSVWCCDSTLRMPRRCVGVSSSRGSRYIGARHASVLKSIGVSLSSSSSPREPRHMHDLELSVWDRPVPSPVNAGGGR